ncbi:MAG: hypothetical protein AAFV07_02485 [Bacteroidota bacterium]
MLRIFILLLLAVHPLVSWAQSPAAVGKALTEQLNKTSYLTSSQKTQVEPIFTKAMMRIARIQATSEVEYQQQRTAILTKMDEILAGMLSPTQVHRYKKARQSGAFKIPDPRRRRQQASRPQSVGRNSAQMQQGRARQQRYQQRQMGVQQPAAPQPAPQQAPAVTQPASTPVLESGFMETESTPAEEESWEEAPYEEGGMEEESYEEESWEEDGSEGYDDGVVNDSVPNQHMLLKSSDFVVDEMLNLNVPTDSAALDSMSKGKIMLKKAGRFIYDEVVKPTVEKKIEDKKAEKAKAKEGNGGS